MGGREVSIHETWTLVLLGRTGDGKSATGNSILGRKAFQSKYSSSGVTSTCELHSAQLDDELTIDVIDTPGLFDLSSDPKIVSKEIVKCIELAKNGIHAVLLVLSVRTRFSKEELAAFRTFQEFFGRKICDYMIVVFTGGDELEDSDETLEGYLDHCPEPLKDTLAMCDGRLVLFDNKSKDPKKKADQLKELLLKVNLVLEKNGHLPYTKEMFEVFKGLKVDFSTSDSNPSSYNEQLIRLTEMVTSRLVDITRVMYELFAKERLARLQAEQEGKEAQMRSEDELSKLREQVARAEEQAEKARKKSEEASKPTIVCNIL